MATIVTLESRFTSLFAGDIVKSLTDGKGGIAGDPDKKDSYVSFATKIMDVSKLTTPTLLLTTILAIGQLGMTFAAGLFYFIKMFFSSLLGIDLFQILKNTVGWVMSKIFGAPETTSSSSNNITTTNSDLSTTTTNANSFEEAISKSLDQSNITNIMDKDYVSESQRKMNADLEKSFEKLNIKVPDSIKIQWDKESKITEPDTTTTQQSGIAQDGKDGKDGKDPSKDPSTIDVNVNTKLSSDTTGLETAASYVKGEFTDSMKFPITEYDKAYASSVTNEGQQVERLKGLYDPLEKKLQSIIEKINTIKNSKVTVQINTGTSDGGGGGGGGGGGAGKDGPGMVNGNIVDYSQYHSQQLTGMAIAQIEGMFSNMTSSPIQKTSPVNPGSQTGK
jgi:hypothetical protein